MLDILGGGNIWALVAVVVGILLGALGIQTGRVKSAKRKAEDEKKRADESERQRARQQQVVTESEEHKVEFVKQKNDVISEIVPEVQKVQSMDDADKKPLSDTVKAAAKAQAERIKKRRTKK